jgi:asparagine N-glycosylation enzyme membrane subunit Stt3
MKPTAWLLRPPQPCALALLGIAALALVLRSLDAPFVFVGDDVILDAFDGAYHARRALYSFLRFPQVLSFDPLMRYPDGAPVPLPPLYDWLLAAVARLFGDDERTFELVLAWSSPVCGALTVVPVFAIAARLAGRGGGLAAAALFALLPASTLSASVGNPDHHAAVALLGACLVALAAGLLAEGQRGALARGVGLFAARTALVLSWSGSLLYVVLGESAFLLGTLATRERALFLAQAWGNLATAAAIVPWVVASGVPLGGPFSGTELSWLHALVLSAVAVVSGGMAWSDRAGPAPDLAPLLTRLALLGLAVALPLGLVAELREGLASGLGFLSKEYASDTLEQVPLFRWLGHAPAWAPDYALQGFGFLAYAIPLVPLAFLGLAREPARRPEALLLFGWSSGLGMLAVLQMRFASDFAPTASVGFALLLGSAARLLSRRWGRRLAAVATAGAAGLLVSPALLQVHLPPLRAVSDFLLEDEPAAGRFESGISTLWRFARLVREVTPPTPGFLDPSAQPGFAVLVRPSYGHLFHYAARCATPANNLGPYLDRVKYVEVRRFFGAQNEQEALDIAARLGTRYVATFDSQGLSPKSFALQLHRSDGSANGHPHTGHFRLIAESPSGAPALNFDFPGGAPAWVIPHKLFERVAGAMLVAQVQPGARVVVGLELRTNTGRRFRWRADGLGDRSGVARVRVPFPTRGAHAPTAALGPYEIEYPGTQSRVDVGGEAVLSGAEVVVPPISARHGESLGDSFE